ncbi:class I adenylate-forming enzyme family protein [Desertibaculum subflavum]|uniref:class I adenylate-forming enzyme family protein n=1 Tax=Desertibaculum subflavum TaxID=2268458 RepID=UPI000E66920B
MPSIRHELHYGDRVMRCFAERPPNIDAMFRASVARDSNALALVDGATRLTYAELDRAVERVAGNLAGLGIGKGDRVAVILGNRREFVFAVLATARIGAVAVPIGTRNRLPENEYVLGHCGAKAVIFEAELAGEIPTRDACPDLAHRFAAGGSGAGARDVAELLAPALAPKVEIAEEDVFCILYTSGTTGRPKGAMLTHFGSIHSALHFEHAIGLKPGDRTVLAVPASHVTGLIAVILSFVAVGGTTFLLPAFKARDFLELMARERINVVILVPAMYNLCLLEPDFASFDLSHWRLGGYGGAPMPEVTIRAMAERLPHLDLYNGYGATETTSPTTAMPPKLGKIVTDSVGKVVHCGEVVVMDEEGREVAPGEKGEIWIAGPMVIPGYWNNAQANAENFAGGFWKSGDIGSIDAEGFVRVFDRKKDMINRAGFKVFSAEVENVLAHHPGVVECAIVGRPDPVLGERTVAFVMPKPGFDNAAELRGFLAERLADYKVPDQIVLIDEPLPRNPNGKVVKAPLRERAAALPSPARR